MKLSHSVSALAAAFALCLWAGAAQAQDASAAPADPSAASAPAEGGGACPTAQAGTEITCIQDWQVRCFKVQGQARCDMFQQLANKNTGQMMLSLSVAYIPTVKRRAVQVEVPLMVSLPRGLKISAGDYTSPVYHYRACDRSGCSIAVLADDALVSGLANGGATGKVVVATDTGTQVPLAFSLKGFSQALDLMTRQTIAKAGGAAAPAAKP